MCMKARNYLQYARECFEHFCTQFDIYVEAKEFAEGRRFVAKSAPEDLTMRALSRKNARLSTILMKKTG